MKASRTGLGGAMPQRSDRLLTAFALFQAADAVGCATLPILQRDLDRLDCPPRVRRLLPFIKAASALGLLLGRRSPRLARITGWALTVYFTCAIGFHVRAKDALWRSAPAASLLVLSFAVALRAGAEPASVISDEAHVDISVSKQSDREAVTPAAG